MKGIDSLVPDSKFVHLHKQANCFPLLPSVYVSNYIDLENEVNTQFCSQRSEIWQRLRSKARVTGSSMFRALSCDTLKEGEGALLCILQGKTSQRILLLKFRDIFNSVVRMRYMQYQCW